MITNAELLNNGWELTGDPIEPISKAVKGIDNIFYSNEHDDDEPKLRLSIHYLYNAPQFGIMLPDGSHIDMNPESIEEINRIEKQIAGYYPPY